MAYLNVTHGVAFDSGAGKWKLSLTISVAPGESSGASSSPLLITRFYDGAVLGPPKFCRVLERGEVGNYPKLPPQDSDISTSRKGVFHFRTNQVEQLFDSYELALNTQRAAKASLEALLTDPSKYPTVTMTTLGALPSREGVAGTFYPGDTVNFSAESGTGDYVYTVTSVGATYDSLTGELKEDSSNLVLAILDTATGKFALRSASTTRRTLEVRVTDTSNSHYTLAVYGKLPETSTTTEVISNE